MRVESRMQHILETNVLWSIDVFVVPQIAQEKVCVLDFGGACGEMRQDIPVGVGRRTRLGLVLAQ